MKSNFVHKRQAHYSMSLASSMFARTSRFLSVVFCLFFTAALAVMTASIASNSSSTVGIAHAQETGKVLIIGDSITNGSKGSIKEKLPNSTIIAQDGAQYSWGNQQLAGQNVDDYDTVIMALGTNGLPTQGDIDATKAMVGDKKLVLMTVTGENVNHSEAFKELARKNRIPTIDWAGAVEQDPDMISGDGLHPKDKAARDKFASLVAKSVDGAGMEYDDGVYDEDSDTSDQARDEKARREFELKDIREKIKKMAEEYLKKPDGDDNDDKEDDPFKRMVDKADKDSDAKSFGAVVNRLLTIGYLNKTPAASNHDKGIVSTDGAGFGEVDGPVQNAVDGANCRFDDPRAGTILYHNCDVPNIMTQFLQSAVASFVTFGPINAEQSSARVVNPAFGMPDTIPNQGAPVLDKDRVEKYTALELFGYNLRVSSYKGEWDDVRVQNSARALSGMGSFERVRATFKAISKGLGSATETAAMNASRQLSSGNVFGAITGFYTGLLSGGFGGTIDSLLDTSDQNVFNQNAWYRVNFGATMYGARELSQEEMAAEMQRLLMEFMGGIKTEEVKIPPELAEIKNVPEAPKEAISSCNYVPQSAETTPAPGIDEAGCMAAYQAAVAAAGAGGAALPLMEWVIDGTQKQEPLIEYRTDYPKARKNIPPDYFDVANRMGLNCIPDGKLEDVWDIPPANSPQNIAKRKEFYSKVSSCWNDAWQKAVDNKLKVDQNEDTKEKIAKKFDSDDFQKWIKEDEQNRNYNAPWRRYVCTDEDGRDIRNADNSYTFLYDMAGTRNSACSVVRAPIQNGVFGNGYDNFPKDKRDTRNFISDTGVPAAALPLNDVFLNVADMGMTISSLATRVSNTALNLAFGTTLDKIGIDKVVEKTMEKLRDGVFYPLIVLFAAFGVIVIFIRSLKNKNNMNTAKELTIVAALVIFGFGMLENPGKIVRGAEEVPARAEQGLLGVIFSDDASKKDQVCSVTRSEGNVVENEKGRDTLSSDAMRKIMCENWRAGAFNPWIFSQFGVGSDYLEVDKMRNTNRDLVGTADVNMGGGNIVHNWGLYQLDVMSSGTATFEDTSARSGAISNDFYRLVDLQAGPNNGQGTDSRYFQMWSGREATNRMVNSILGAGASIMLSITVTAYAVAKIQVNITMLLMLGLLPFMLLIALSPMQARGKYRAYMGTLVGLMIQRVAFTVMLGIIFRIMFSLGSASSNGVSAMLGTFVVSLIFFTMRKEFVGVIESSVSGITNGAGMMKGGKDDSNLVPGYIHNKLQRARWGASALAGGAAGGFAAGGLSGAEPSIKRAWSGQMNYINRLQRYRGKGSVQTFSEAMWRGQGEAKADLDRDPFVQDMKDRGYHDSKVYRKYEKDLEAYSNFNGKEQKGANGVFKLSSDGSVMNKPIPPRQSTSSERLSARKARKVSAAAKGGKKRLENFDQSLRRDNISVGDNGEYMQFRGNKKLIEQAKKKATAAGEANWGQFIDRDEIKAGSVNVERVSSQKRAEIKDEFDDIQQEINDGVDNTKKYYEKNANKDYTRQKMKDALSEARERAGQAHADRRFF